MPKASAAYYAAESRYGDATVSWFNGDFEDITKCARFHDVKAKVLRRRIAGGNSKSTRKSTTQRLNEVQNAALMHYIKRLDDINQSATPELVVGAANFILHRTDPLSDPVGQNWYNRFMHRHPELHRTTQRPLDIDRKDANCIEVLEEYFEKLRVKIEDYGIVKEDLWNMDETGFRVGCARSCTVITFDDTKKKKNIIADPSNRDYCTSVEVISAAGETIPPLLILKAKHVLYKWGAENDLDDDVLFGCSDSGYSNDDLAIDWLHHFIKHTTKKRVGKTQMLIIDGFGSHMTHEFFDIADKHDIILFKLPAHSTHLTQPLDVGVFQPYKANHGKAIQNAIRNGDGKFSRLEFLAALQGFRDKTFTLGTVKNAWRRTGIYPFNPEVVLKPLRGKRAEEMFAKATQAARPSTPPSADFECLNHTPRGPATMKRAFKFLDDIQSQHGGEYRINPEHMGRFLKAAKRDSLTLDIKSRDLDQALEDTANRKKRAGLRAFRPSTFGVVEKRDCRKMYSDREKKAAAADARKATKLAIKKEQLQKEVEELKERMDQTEEVEVEEELEHLISSDIEPAPKKILPPEVVRFNEQIAGFERQRG